MIRLFLSYRRSDSQDVVDRIFDRLVAEFSRGGVFRDVDSIPAGADFRRTIEDAVKQTNVLLAVIGPGWLAAADEGGRSRLSVPEDVVRCELETALANDIPVIPILVRNASMPRTAELPASLSPLPYRNGFVVRPDPDFHSDMSRLVASVRRTYAAPVPASHHDLRTAAPRFFYYISRAKVEMLLPQFEGGERSSPNAAEGRVGDDLIERTERLVHALDRGGAVRGLVPSEPLEPSFFYSSRDTWRNGLFYFRTLASLTVTYLLWKEHGQSLIVLAGSPDNVIGNRSARCGIHVPSSADAITSLSSMPILQAISTDEPSWVVARGQSQLQYMQLAPSSDSEPRVREAGQHEPIFTVSHDIALAAFCLRELAALPEMKMECVFRVYSKMVSKTGDFWSDFEAEHRKGQAEYSTIYPEAALAEADRVGLRRYGAIYVGSPVYTAIG